MSNVLFFNVLFFILLDTRERMRGGVGGIIFFSLSLPPLSLSPPSGSSLSTMASGAQCNGRCISHTGRDTGEDMGKDTIDDTDALYGRRCGIIQLVSRFFWAGKCSFSPLNHFDAVPPFPFPSLPSPTRPRKTLMNADTDSPPLHKTPNFHRKKTHLRIQKRSRRGCRVR